MECPTRISPMAELPYMQFFPADYLRDTEILSLSAQGGWMRMLCSMWHPSRRGVLSLRLQAMARLLHASEQTTKSIMEEIEECDVGRVEWSGDGDRVTITCRRIVRDWETVTAARSELSGKRSEAAKARWAKHRQSTGTADAEQEPCKSHANAEPLECYPDTRNQSNKRERESAGVGTRRPTLDEAKSAAANIGVKPEKADEWWHAREASEWMKGTAGGGTTPVGTNWQADLKTYASRGGFDSSRSAGHRKEKAEAEYPEPPKPALPRA